jgi:hypothetical protein
MGEPTEAEAALLAARLGLKLTQDSRRWVASARRVRPPRCDPRSELIFEVDLDDEDSTPLTQYTEDQAKRRVARRARGPLEGRIDPVRLFSPATHLPTPELFLTGVYPFPQPGQDRGPLAPRATPEAMDLRRAERPGAVTGIGYTGMCYCCKGSRLGLEVACHCGRWSRDGQLRHDDRPKPPKRASKAGRVSAKEPAAARGKVYRPEGSLKGGIGA